MNGKLTSLLLLLTLMISSCGKEAFINQPEASLSETTPNNEVREDLVVSKDQASLLASEIYEAITKEGEPRTKDCMGDVISSATAQKESGCSKVTSMHTIKQEGTPTLYIINFGTHEGYIVLSAYKNDGIGLLLFNSSGEIKLDQNDDNSPFSVWLSEQSNRIYKRITEDQNMPSIRSAGMWDLFETPLKDGEEIDIVLHTTALDKVTTETELRGTHKGSRNLRQVPPYSTIEDCLWGQGAGYNADAKIPNALAGCPAVAIGLYCRTKHIPAKYDYANMPNTLSTSSSNAISRMFRDIAGNIPNYQWGVNGSGARSADILIGLKKIGFNQAKLSSYDFNIAYKQIENNYPVLLAAFSNQSGHIWIADGYWEQKWTITRKFLWWKVKSWTEYSDMLYMNWGWNGTGNGWVDQESWRDYYMDRNIYYDLKQ